MKRQWVLSILLLGIAMLGQAQNFEDEFNAFLNQSQQQFNSFSDSINKQFAQAMEANMKTFVEMQPKVRDPKPKPVKVPEVPKNTPSPLPKINPLKPNVPLKPEPVRPSLPDMKLPESVKPLQPDAPNNPPQDNTPSVPSSEQVNRLDFNLFGEDIQVMKNPFQKSLSGISAKDVSTFWIQLSECDYEPMLQTCQKAHAERGFNDWATYQLVLELANQTYPEQYNEQAVMTVFLLNQLGMEAKVGFGNSHLFCLIAVAQQLYGISFADIAENRYYHLETDPAFKNVRNSMSFRTYDTPFPNRTHALDMHIHHPLKSVPNGTPDTLIYVNMNMIELYKTYPQVDIEVYANAVPSKEFCASVNRIIKPFIENLPPFEATKLLLEYVQYGFDYATDKEQFGYEKPFFCEENYYYPKNDCEDRCVLFAFLVRHLLNLDVVLVDYPGHVATAVHFPTEVKGKSVEYQGKRYVICDPTYVGASVGMEMPGFTPADRTVIPLKR